MFLGCTQRTYPTILAPFFITYRWALGCVGEQLLYLFGLNVSRSDVHSLQASPLCSSLQLFCYGSVVGGDLTTRDEGNIESSGLINGQGEEFTGYRKESLELNTLRLLQQTKAQVKSVSR